MLKKAIILLGALAAIAGAAYLAIRISEDDAGWDDWADWEDGEGPAG